MVSPPIHMLISSRDLLTDTPRDYVLPALWTALSPVMLAHSSNHQRSVLELRQPTFKGRDGRPCCPLEDAQHRITRMCEMDYIQYGHSWNPICHSPHEKELRDPSNTFPQVTRFLCPGRTGLFRDYRTRALSPSQWGPSSTSSNLHQSGHGTLMNGGYA